MGLMQSFKEYFGGKSSLASIDMKDLRRQIGRLNVREREIERDMKRFERDRQRLLDDYAKARAQNDQTRIKMLARRFEETKPVAQQFDQRHAMLVKERRVISHLKLLKENEKQLMKDGRQQWLNMDVGELQIIVEDAAERHNLQGESVDELLRHLEFQQEESQSSLDNRSDTLAEMDRLLAEQPVAEEPNVPPRQRQVAKERSIQADVEKEIDEIDSLLAKTRSSSRDRS